MSDNDTAKADTPQGHTSGPWFARENSVTSSPQESSIAVCVAQGTRSVSEARANARLIAAAPEMLELLIECRDWIKRWHHDDRPDLCEKADAAIAKAEGGS